MRAPVRVARKAVPGRAGRRTAAQFPKSYMYQAQCWRLLCFSSGIANCTNGWLGICYDYINESTAKRSLNTKDTTYTKV
jgi:hypothetical protein